MNCRFKDNLIIKRVFSPGFTILEVIAALAILTIICTTTLVVLDRCMQATIDSELKMQAFKVARENMEKLLANKTVEQMVEFGTLEENPNIDWQMVVEPFREPATSKMWIRAVCTASYIDSKGEMQRFELNNWITDLTDAQVKQLLDQKRREEEFIAATGENPFGEDTAGRLKWMKHLMDTGDIDAATDVANQIKQDDPGALPKDYDPADHIKDDIYDDGDDTDTTTPQRERFTPDEYQAFKKGYIAGNIPLAEVIEASQDGRMDIDLLIPIITAPLQ